MANRIGFTSDAAVTWTAPPLEFSRGSLGVYMFFLAVSMATFWAGVLTLIFTDLNNTHSDPYIAGVMLIVVGVILIFIVTHFLFITARNRLESVFFSHVDKVTDDDDDDSKKGLLSPRDTRAVSSLDGSVLIMSRTYPIILAGGTAATGIGLLLAVQHGRNAALMTWFCFLLGWIMLLVSIFWSKKEWALIARALSVRPGVNAAEDVPVVYNEALSVVNAEEHESEPGPSDDNDISEEAQRVRQAFFQKGLHVPGASQHGGFT